MSDESTSSLLLKWGTLKGWSDIPESNQDILRIFLEGASSSCAADRPDEERKHILIDLIQAHEGTIQNDWDGDFYTKDEAIDYVTNYGK